MKSTLDVHFYCSPSGVEPVRDWLLSLDRDARRAIGTDIKTVQLGWPMGMPLVRKLGAGLWEVRSHIPQGIARIVFTTRGRTMVLLHGFIKKSQHTPATDLELATRRMKEVTDER